MRLYGLRNWVEQGYKQVKHEAISYEPPETIIAKLRAIESEIDKDLGELEAML